MAETQLIHPPLGGQQLSPLHRPGCDLRCSPGGREPVFILLFFNLGVKFPPKQSWLQWGQTRCQVGWKLSQLAEPDPPGFPPALLPRSWTSSSTWDSPPKKSAAPSTLLTCHPPSRHLPAQGFEQTKMLRAQGESSPSRFLCSLPSAGAMRKDKEP